MRRIVRAMCRDPIASGSPLLPVFSLVEFYFGGQPGSKNGPMFTLTDRGSLGQASRSWTATLIKTERGQPRRQRSEIRCIVYGASMFRWAILRTRIDCEQNGTV